MQIPPLASAEFVESLSDPLEALSLFDYFDNLTYFLKDHLGRYIACNDTLMRRCGHSEKKPLIGKTSMEMYPDPLGQFFLSQDLAVVRTGNPLLNEMEQHPYPNHKNGWCLTTKLPLRNKAGHVVGLVGMSRDIQAPDQDPEIYASVARVVQHVKQNLDSPLKSADLAEMAGLSVWQLDQQVKSLFGVSAAQLVLQTRMDTAARALRETKVPITAVALSAGYGDQSAFTRQFRKTFGMTPGEYRRKS